jgi:copper chaperone CopZ
MGYLRKYATWRRTIPVGGIVRGRRAVVAMASKTYTVTGMTCGHCVSAVTEEVGKVDGVAEVDVVLETGAVTVTGEGFTDEQVAAAVDEAGYALT